MQSGDILIPSFENLTFTEKDHQYLLDGVQIPSVTTLMEPLSGAEYRTINKAVLDKAAKRGTSVHNSIKDYLRYGVNTCDDEFRGYMDGFVAWYEYYKPTILATEMRMYHKVLRYAGTLDLLCLIDNEVTLIDYKTTNKVMDKLLRVQLEGYSQGLSSWGITVERKHALHLSGNGQWQFPEYKAKDAEALRIFMALKYVYDYARS